jgi:hypothetical protein
MNITPAKSAPAPAIIEPERDNPPVVLSEGLALLQVIERASRDPNVDIDKMERLIAMRERMRLVDAETQFSAALAEMQDELPVIEEHGKIDIGRGKPQAYALWEDINEAIKPVLAKHGFSLSFKTGEAENRVTVTGVLRHRAGHREETTMKLPIDTSGSKNAVQAVGSSTSYGKRYTAAALLNLTSRLPEDRDDDGNAAGIRLISEQQMAEIQSLIDATDTDIAKFCGYMKVDALVNIAAKDFDRAMTALRNKKGAKA